MIFLRKFLGFALTTLFIGLCLTFLFVVTDGSSFLVIGLLLTGAFPFVLLIGVPVSFLSDYLTKNSNDKQRYKKAFFIHILSGVLAGLVISFYLEGLFFVGITIIGALIFWLVDEFLRKTF